MKVPITTEQARHLIEAVLDEVEVVENHGDYVADLSFKSINDLVKHFDFVLRTNPDICPECLTIIQDDWHTSEVGGAAGEIVCTGWKCKCCGREMK